MKQEPEKEKKEETPVIEKPVEKPVEKSRLKSLRDMEEDLAMVKEKKFKKKLRNLK